MSHVAAYNYDADIYCCRCTIHRLVEEKKLAPPAYDMPVVVALRLGASSLGFDMDYESDYDSWDWPKVVFDDQIEDDDHCGWCDRHLVDVGPYENTLPAGWPDV